MSATYSDRIAGVETATAIKTPVRAATTANITLSGQQTIDGVAVVAGDRVLVKDQTDTTENGIYVASADAWARSLDMNGARDITEGTAVYVTDGLINAGLFYAISTSSPAIGAPLSFRVLTDLGLEVGVNVQAYNDRTVIGPASPTDTNLAVFDGTTGALLKDSGKKASDFATAAQGTKADNAAPKASPALTGTPTAPTATAGTDTTQIATTAFANAAVAEQLSANGFAPMFACRAWVNFDGSDPVVIRGSGNVSSVTRNVAGDYTINFTTALEDANYAVITTIKGEDNTTISANNNPRWGPYAEQTTSSVRVWAVKGSSTLDDAENISVAIFR